MYDVTAFLNDHPGGKKILLKNSGGMDASKQFDAFHARSVLDKFGPEFYIGEFGDPPAQPVSSVENSEDEELYEPFGELIPFGDPAWYQDSESPYYKDSHRRLRTKIREFVDKELMPHAHEWDESKAIPSALYRRFAQLGLVAAATGSPLPTEYMDNKMIMDVVPVDEFDMFHEFILLDELARCGSAGVVWGLLGGVSIGLPPIILFGTEEMKRKVIPEVFSGEKTICLCITEPYAGSDVSGLRCEARESPDGQHWIVNG